MSRPLFQALRFMRGWRFPPGRVDEQEIEIEPGPGGGGGDRVRGLLRGPADDRPRPGWIVLHGITRRGLDHPSLRQFTGGLVATGARVLVPEVREWTELHFAPERAQRILRAAIRTLAERPDVEEGGVVVAGFSFGGPQALVAAADQAAGQVRGVLVWGSYADLGRTLHFQFTGEHGFGEGDPAFRDMPDPYGRWVVGANCLALLDGRPDPDPVARALRELAVLAGDRKVYAGSAVMDSHKERLGRVLPSAGDRALFELFAPPAGTLPDRDAALELARNMDRAARGAWPLLDPIPTLGPINRPVRLMHGRSDRLIPFTETPELARRLHPIAPDLGTGITGLFAHSGGEPTGGIVHTIRESVHFVRVLRRAFEVV